MDRLVRSVSVGFRSLRRTPGFTATAVLTLALGIGLSTAVFAVADAFLFRPLAVRDQDRVVVLWGATRDGRFDNFPLLLRGAREFAARTRALERVEFFGYGGAGLLPVRDGSGGVLRIRRALVSGGYFDLLGTKPVLGRALQPSDDVTGAAPVIVVSYRAWQRYFGGDPNVLGRRLVVHHTGVAHTIVGVMPRGLDYPRGTDFWAPVIPNSGPLGNEPVYAELHVIGRLRPGASPADASADLSSYFARPEADQWQRDMRGVAHTLPNAILGDVGPAVVVVAVATGLLLLITCINVANLLLVRGLARVREMAVRSALGAGRGRIIGQLMTESAILAFGGGVLGTALAAAAVRGFLAFAPEGTPRLGEIHLNATAIGAAVAITALVTLLFALAPAVVTSSVELQDVLRSGTRQSGASRRFRLGTEALVIGQVALALVVLSAAGLLARSFVKLERADLAFDPAKLAVVELALPSEGFNDPKQQIALIDRLVPRLAAIPGVRAVTPVLTAPFVAAGGIFGQIAAEGQGAHERTQNPTLIFEVVTPNYFSTFGLRIVRGRGFTDADREGSTRVVLLSESAASHYWPGADPIGKRLVVADDGVLGTVVGIVPDTRYRDLRDARPSIYFPLRQVSFPVVPLTLAIRAQGSSADVIPAIRQRISEGERGVAVASAAPFEAFLEGPLAQPRLNALLLAIFAGAAVALAGVGLFGVMATTVRQRTRELGIRMALGATAPDLRRMVMRRGLALAAAGLAAGVLGALATNRLLVAMLYAVSPTDAFTLAAVALLLLGISALATLVPARSSTRIDPVIALRAEG
jgi:putative ABC transport system permease protein